LSPATIKNVCWSACKVPHPALEQNNINFLKAFMHIIWLNWL